MNKNTNNKMGLNATWSMAVGGMVGGGIFATLGLVIELAGSFAWVAYLFGGVCALITGISYASLVKQYGEGGGVFLFLRKVDQKTLAGHVSWLLIISYVLTISVYAFTFGHYLAYMLGFEQGLTARIGAASIIIVLAGVNLRGVGNAAWLEIFSVWGKLIILLGLSLIGLWHFKPELLQYAKVEFHPVAGIGIGASIVFMAYEGFQLLAYDYEDIQNPQKTLPLAIVSAIISVTILYVLITLGTTALIGPEAIVTHKEIAVAKAGQAALGTVGMIIVSFAAVLSTASAINSTLFSTARLSKHVAKDHDLPFIFTKENQHNVPKWSLIILASIATVLAVIGNLGPLVEGASLLFLTIFATVNMLAALNTKRWIALKWSGAIVCSGLVLANAYYIAIKHVWVLCVLLGLMAAIVIFRPKCFKEKRNT